MLTVNPEMVRKSPLVLLVASLSLGCFGVGRKSSGEVRLPAEVPDRGAAFSNALYQTVGVRLEPGNQVDFVNNGKVFDAAVEEIRRAKKNVHIVTFIWSDSDTSRKLIAAISE